MSATDVLNALELAFCGRRPGDRILLRECPVGRGPMRRVDALLIEFRGSRPATRTAFEVKIDRRDFDIEVANPDKRAAAMAVADQFYFATPVGLVGASDIPDDCGLMWIESGCAPTLVKHAPISKADAPDWSQVQTWVRRAYAQGQSDTAKRQALPGWKSVLDIAQHLTLAVTECVNQRRDLADRGEVALKSLQNDLGTHGYAIEAAEIRQMRKCVLRAVGGDQRPDDVD